MTESTDWRRYARQQFADADKYDSYEEYYLDKTKGDDTPEALVGPEDTFESQRQWQESLLKVQGLEPDDTLLDFGCGVLRGGIPFIKYLDEGNYYGADLSQKALMDGHRRIHENRLGHKQPTLIQNHDLSFDRISQAIDDADYMLFQSVWTHLPADRLKTCLDNMGKALADDGIILATIYSALYGEGPTHQRAGVDWAYSIDWITGELDDRGYMTEVIPVPHPTNQTTLRIDKI